MNQKTKLLAVIAIILAVVAVIAFFVFQKQKAARPTQTKGPASQSTIRKSDVDFAKAPARFPSDVPIESGAKIVQNYNATTIDGRFQATRVFETSQTLSANLKLYTSYLTNNGWEIVATTDQANYKMVTGSKDNKTLQVSIDENSANSTKTVSISYTEDWRKQAN